MIASNTLQVLYQDEHFIVVNKPSGLLVHRSEVDRWETRFALQIVRDQIGQRVYPVHRLDKPTSGVLLFALHAEAARKIMEHFQNNKILKTYTAVVRGYALWVIPPTATVGTMHFFVSSLIVTACCLPPPGFH